MIYKFLGKKWKNSPKEISRKILFLCHFSCKVFSKRHEIKKTSNLFNEFILFSSRFVCLKEEIENDSFFFEYESLVNKKEEKEKNDRHYFSVYP